MDIESHYHKKIDKSRKQEKHKGETFLRKAEEIIKDNNKSSSIKEEDFKNVYGHKEVDQDIREVKERKEKFRQKENSENRFSKRYSDVIETILTNVSSEAGWFGSDIKVSKASDFDDFNNETDLIFELGSPDNVLAVQLTYSEMYDKVKDKVKSVADGVDSGDLSEIKYFKSKFDEDKKGHLNKVPRVVVAISFDDVRKITKLWSAEFAGLPSPVEEKHRKILENSSVQAEILLQITENLEALIRKSKEEGKNDLVKIFQKRLSKIEDILKEEEFEKLKDKQKENESSRLTEVRRIVDKHIA